MPSLMGIFRRRRTGQFESGVSRCPVQAPRMGAVSSNGVHMHNEANDGRRRPETAPPGSPGGPGSAGGGTVVRSEYATDPDMAGILDEFVTGLPAQIDELLGLLAAGDADGLRRALHRI